LNTTSRALATVAVIDALERHPDADRLQVATIRGWRAVVGSDQGFAQGDRVLFIEPDAFLDAEEPRFGFLTSRSCRTAPDGRRGHVLRTTQLRGILSQGLVMRLSDWADTVPQDAAPGTDVTPLLPIRLWEVPIPPGTQIAGSFPEGVGKTDEERVQNIGEERIAAACSAPTGSLVVTEKLDGTSITVMVKDGALLVAGRNWTLAPGCGTYRIVEATQAVQAFLSDRSMREECILQGELVGPGVQGNPLGLNANELRLFNVAAAGEGRRLVQARWHPDLQPYSVPVLQVPVACDVDGWLAQADRMSALNPQRRAEGVVVRTYDGHGRLLDSFKAISNRYLLKHAA
jgi:RNA ligase (TIGR02306 family)